MQESLEQLIRFPIAWILMYRGNCISVWPGLLMSVKGIYLIWVVDIDLPIFWVLYVWAAATELQQLLRVILVWLQLFRWQPKIDISFSLWLSYQICLGPHYCWDFTMFIIVTLVWSLPHLHLLFQRSLIKLEWAIISWLDLWAYQVSCIIIIETVGNYLVNLLLFLLVWRLDYLALILLHRHILIEWHGTLLWDQL